LKGKSLQEANTKLQATLSETQDELEKLIKQYEGLSQAIAASERGLSLSRKLCQDLRRELDERTHTLSDMKERDQLRERELTELYAQVEHKDSLMTECERRLVRSLRDKEQELAATLKRLEILEAEKRDLSSKIQVLEQRTEDTSQEA